MTGLTDVLTAWLPGQRWYAGKGLEVERLTADVAGTLQEGDPAVLLVLVDVEAGGRTDRYQVPLSARREAVADYEHAYVGAARVGGATRHLYDAPHDPDANLVWLRLIAAGATAGGVAFEGKVEEIDLAARPLPNEQSNTSINYGDRYLLKLYRRLTPSPNPDLEVTRALATVDTPYVPLALGWLEGHGATLGLLQPFLKGATEGWTLALTSVRDLYAETDLHADEVGGDFAPESFRLGTTTAAVHEDLARVLPSRTAGPPDTRATAALLRERLAAAVTAVPDLKAHATAIESAYAELDGLMDDVPVQRIHGDLHLGQVLRTDTGWVITDFEGEPARAVEERRALMSPLRDVAGMLRSFDYAARHLLADHPDAPQLAYRADEWADRNRSAYCDGYAEQSGTDPRDQAALLRALELDKAVYEVVYEARHRPAWIGLPLAGIARLLG